VLALQRVAAFWIMTARFADLLKRLATLDRKTTE
jgi:hypothetical protein